MKKWQFLEISFMLSSLFTCYSMDNIGNIESSLGNIPNIGNLSDIGNLKSLNNLSNLNLTDLNIKDISSSFENLPGNLEQIGKAFVNNPLGFLKGHAEESLEAAVKTALGGMNIPALKTDFNDISTKATAIGNQAQTLQVNLTQKDGFLNQIQKLTTATQKALTLFGDISPDTLGTVIGTIQRATILKEQVATQLATLMQEKETLTTPITTDNLQGKIKAVTTLNQQFSSLENAIGTYSTEEQKKLASLISNVSEISTNLTNVKNSFNALTPQTILNPLSQILENAGQVFEDFVQIRKDLGVSGNALINSQLNSAFQSTGKNLITIAQNFENLVKTEQEPLALSSQLSTQLFGENISTQLPLTLEAYKATQIFVQDAQALYQNILTAQKYLVLLNQEFNTLAKTPNLSAQILKKAQQSSEIGKTSDSLSQEIMNIQTGIKKLRAQEDSFQQYKPLLTPFTQLQKNLPTLTKKALSLKQMLANTQTQFATQQTALNQEITDLQKSITQLQTAIKSTTTFTTGIPDRIKSGIASQVTDLKNLLSNPKNALKAPAAKAFADQLTGLKTDFDTMKKDLAIVLRNTGDVIGTIGTIGNIAILTPLQSLISTLSITIAAALLENITSIITTLQTNLKNGFILIANNL